MFAPGASSADPEASQMQKSPPDLPYARVMRPLMLGRYINVVFYIAES